MMIKCGRYDNETQLPMNIYIPTNRVSVDSIIAEWDL